MLEKQASRWIQSDKFKGLIASGNIISHTQKQRKGKKKRGADYLSNLLSCFLNIADTIEKMIINVMNMLMLLLSGRVMLNINEVIKLIKKSIKVIIPRNMMLKIALAIILPVI